MVVFGILLLVLGAISTAVFDDSEVILDQVINMNVLGGILIVLGAISLLMGLIYMYMATNTSHAEYEEHDVVVDTPPEEKPVVVKRRKPRTPKKGV
jgi:hypothetical protein